MTIRSTYPAPGVYQYTYPTFVDTPQLICVHFLTPDRQQAFVSYSNQKAAKLIPLSWFDSVQMVKREGQPQLMPFLEETLTGWLKKSFLQVEPNDSSVPEVAAYRASRQMAA